MSEGTTSAAVEGDGWEWAAVEIFGHRRHAGRTREEVRFGTPMLRIDVPNKGDPAAFGWSTFWYGGGAVFSIVPADEAACLRANLPFGERLRLGAPISTSEEDDVQGGEADA